ncbi:DNA polymerase IV [Candidatus Falkowbacteria bacterium HGW-Falkowbacteria-2]|uniref:DNA polymerase IV n=1 Tax=Candidatus Falkowbacteria bacterium HGW-Falkowbacteria-2 TaxID=2013769 RepID=A0A2N2E3C4_9BACT|nr:MAG: DNA polymerase IV [Candidatus Falkowbacteria bacterium HGW-Falkowbacteria-2]
MPVSISSFPRAILHVDGDCFFAACEIARRPGLKGKPVVTGLERGIVSSLTYEAKAMGVKRAMSFSEVKKICPQAVFLPSDYESYSLYSLRMYSIVRRFTPDVEEYSIDECFADLTGLRRPLRMSYETMAEKIKEALDSELGFTFSLGLAPTKVLAKIGSKWKKPSGLTVIPGRDIELYLAKLDVGQVWGIGPQTTALLNKLGVRTALDFIRHDVEWVKARLTKPQLEIWQELRGEMAYPIDTEKKNSYQSISKTKTFTPPSKDETYVFSQLSKNVENACIKLRRHRLAAKKVFFFLKTQDFKFHGYEFKLMRATDNPVEIIAMVKQYFSTVFKASSLFRATGVVLMDISENVCRQADLFNEVARAEKISKIFGSVDGISKRYGKHTMFLGSSFAAMTGTQHEGARQTAPDRKREIFKGETARKRLSIPYLGETG